MFRLHRWVPGVSAGLATIALVLALPARAAAQTHGGVRAGVSSDPTQFYFGGHIETKKLFDEVTFRPNAEVGVGDNLTVFTANFEFVYSWDINKHPWRVYAGAGPALVIFGGSGDRPDHSDSDVGGGFNILIGAQHKKGLFSEIKVGLGDCPEFKFGIGYAFK